MQLSLGFSNTQLCSRRYSANVQIIAEVVTLSQAITSSISTPAAENAAETRPGIAESFAPALSGMTAEMQAELQSIQKENRPPRSQGNTPSCTIYCLHTVITPEPIACHAMVAEG